jgi:hypothetical protein
MAMAVPNQLQSFLEVFLFYCSIKTIASMPVAQGNFNLHPHLVGHPFFVNYHNLNTTIMRRVSNTNQILCVPLTRTGRQFFCLTTVCILFTLFWAMPGNAQLAPVSPPTGGFAIDGGLRANTPVTPSPFAANQGDWYPGTGGTGGSVFNASGVPFDALTSGRATPDAYTSNDNVFTTGSKFNDYIGDLHWFTNSAPDKNDINNALYHISRDAANNQWAFMAGDRLSTNGTSYIDFEFLQGTVVVNANGSFTGTTAPNKNGGGGRTENDMIVSMEYTNGGSKPNVYVYQWKLSGSTWSYQLATITNLAANAFAETNRSGAETNLPYTAFGNTSYQQYAFVEAAVNITYLLSQISGGQACSGLSIKTLWVKTKASASSTAALKDFVNPISVNFNFGSSEITNPGPFCSNNNTAYTLTATPSGGTFTVDGQPATTFTPSIAGAGDHAIAYSYSGCSATATFKVTQTPTVNDPADQVKCAGANSNVVTFSGTAATSYTWTNSNTAIGLAASGTGDIAAFQTTNSTTAAISGTITVTPHNTANGITCDGPAQNFTITVNPIPTVSDPTDQVKCTGAATDAVTFSGTSATSFTWTNDNTSIGLGASGTGNIASFTTTNATSAALVATITVTPHFTGGGQTCDGSPQSFTITVNPTPTVNDPADQVKCAGASSNAVTFTGSGATSYTWTNSNTSIGLSASSGTGNIAAFTTTNSTSAAISSTITVTPHFTGGGLTCDGTPQSFTITVNPTPTVSDPSDQVKCKGANSNAVTFSGTGATSFTWVNDNTSIGLGASGTGNIAAFQTTNGTNAPITGTITVTPHFAGGGQTCDGTPQSFTITVNPTPTVNDPADQTVCSGSSTTAVSFSGAVSGTTFNWTNNNTSIGLAASGTGDIPAFNGINNGSTPAVATITVTPSANGCTGTPQSFTITVSNVPAAPTICIVQPSLCGPAKGSIKVVSPLVAGYQYSKDNGATWQDCNVFLNVDAGTNPVVKYKTSATATGCVSNSATCSNATICAEQPVACTGGNFSRLAPKTEVVTETSTLKVTAYPNPFNEKINFVVTSPVSGKGSLDVYNSLGQKIRTVYQGNINKGSQNFELRLSQRQVSNLIYVLRVDGQQVSGKILQVNQ